MQRCSQCGKRRRSVKLASSGPVAGLLACRECRKACVYDDKKWDDLRDACLERDDFTCINRPEEGIVGCGKRFADRPEVLHARHKVSAVDGGPRTLDNLVCGCRWCHGRETATEDGGFGNPRKPSGKAGRRVEGLAFVGDEILGEIFGEESS
jgi:5-methylcytosine-specific restriction endonuclease McrA